MTNKFSILIVEDDLMIAEMLREMLHDLDYFVIGISTTYESAIGLLEKNRNTDLCFVDINLEQDKNGFDVARTIQENLKVPFVFLTSYSDKKTIAEAAALQPEAYLVKPFSETDLLTTIEIIRNRKKENFSAEKFIFIKDGTLTAKISTRDILWLKSDNIYVEVVTRNKTFLVRTSLEKYFEELNDKSFLRSHRSYVVNLNHVKAVNGQYVMVNDEKIPVSRKFRDDIISLFKS